MVTAENEIYLQSHKDVAVILHSSGELLYGLLVWDPLYGDLSCMQVWARILKTNVFDMYASCTFSLCVLHPFSCNLLLAVITDVSFIAFEWSAASWIMFIA